MAFSDFTVTDLQTQLGVHIREVPDLHGEIAELDVPPSLSRFLETSFPLATSIATEKAKSEMIVAPVLMEVRETMKQKISLFSGGDFTIDRHRGLAGRCDFLLSLSPVQSFVKAPVAVVVEAKDDSIAGGLGQCGAEMVAARIFNEKSNTGIETIHGCVTTGTLWRFMSLKGDDLTLDRKEYTLPDRLAKVLGILVHAVGGPLVEPHGK